MNTYREEDKDKLYQYRLTNGDIVIWKLESILPIMEVMGQTFIGCIVSGTLKKIENLFDY